MIKVPRGIISAIDRQIAKQRQLVASAQKHLQELEAARAEMEPTETEHGDSGRARGGHARAEKLSPDRRHEIAKRAADKRWRNTRSVER